MPLKDAVATVLNRNAYYRDGYRLLLRIGIIQGVIILVLAVSIIGMLITIQDKRIYFATTSDGRIINIVPLEESYRTNGEVIAWATTTAKNVMRFDYNDYRERLQQMSTDFTTTGWDSFSKALKESQIIDAITAHKLVVSMEIEAAPEITQAAPKNGVFTWHLQMPVTIKFDGDQPPQPISRILYLEIQRVSTLQNPEGISIEQWVTLKSNQ
jgi:intracellular multiplication protein IcmL